MLNVTQLRLVKDAIDLKKAQIARFAKTQPSFQPIAEQQILDYDRLVVVLQEMLDAPSGSKKG